MREVHITRGPIWNGQPDSPKFLGVAHFRLVDKQDYPHKGNILVYCDYKIHEKNSDDPNAMVLMWKYPFIIKCIDAINYPTQYVGEGYKRTKLHIIPVDHMKVYETRRKRCQSQDEFKQIKEQSLAVKQETE